MIRFFKPAAWLLTFAFLIQMVVCGIFPATTAQAKTLIQQLSESTAGGLNVTWYSAKRFSATNTATNTQGLDNEGVANLISLYNSQIIPGNTARVDLRASISAFDSCDRSVRLGTQSLSDLTFDMTKWVWGDNSTPSLSVRDNYVWGEITGYIKMPESGALNVYLQNNSSADFRFEFYDGDEFYGKWRTWKVNAWTQEAVLPENSYVFYDLSRSGPSADKGQFIPFRMRIGDIDLEPDKPDKIFSLMRLRYVAASGEAFDIPMDSYYSKLSLEDMRPFFKFNQDDFTLTLDPIHQNFPVGNYEYGIVASDNVSTAAGFQPLRLGVNKLTPDSGSIIIRDKTWKNSYTIVGNASLSAPRNLAVTRRTSSTASLSWQPPQQEVPQGYVIPYEIYRKPVAGKNLFSFNNTLSVQEPSKVGATTGLTFTDQGLAYDGAYEYFVKAQYPTGYSSPSVTARTDSIAMEGLASTPDKLKVELVNQIPKADLRLSWAASSSPAGIKEYVVYRRIIQDSTGTWNPDGSYTIGGITETYPREIARTAGLSYLDRGLNLTDTCEYYVQAFDNNGSPSYISSVLAASPQKLVPPTAPGELLAGSVLRQGDGIQYDFPGYSRFRNILMGPQREIALRWDPSSSKSGIAGYSIYRVDKTLPAASAGVPSPLIDDRLSARPADATTASARTVASGSVSLSQKDLVGATSDTLFVDQGVEFGRVYLYYVEAKDNNGNAAMSQILVGTGKSSLSCLAITDGSQPLVPEPAFAYYQTQYTLGVANEVKSIILNPQKTDPQAKVMVNGTEVSGDGGIPVALAPGENTVLIDVVPRGAVQSENVRYTLTVNRANIENPPVLTLPESGVVLDEGSTYKEAGRINIPTGQIWTGTVDYGDRTGEKPLAVNADGTFNLEHKYLDNGQCKINVNFKYEDLGLVKGSVDLTVQNVAPALTGPGIKDELTTQEGSQVTIEGSITDPGQDSWAVSGDYGSEWGPVQGKVKEDKSFALQHIFYDLEPEYDMVLKVIDDDSGESAKHIKIKVENVAPSVQAGKAAMIQRGTAFTGTGVFTDPGLDLWQATVDYGDGSGQQTLTFKNDKTFALNHIYLKSGIFTVTVQVADQDGGAGSASFPVKVKDYVFTLEAGADASLKEGENLARDIPVRGMADKIQNITVDYGDGSGEKPVTMLTPSNKKPVLDYASQAIQAIPAVQASTVEKTSITVLPQIGIIPLQHLYTDNGTYTVKIKLTDIDGDNYEGSFNAEVINVPPALQMEPIGNVNVDNPFTCHGSITDPGADTWTVEIDFKDGSEPCKINVEPDKTFNFSHSYSSPGNYNIEAVVRDDDGGIWQTSQSVSVLASSGSSASHDSSLHSLVGLHNLKQDDALNGYTGDGLNPACLIYTCSGAFMYTPIEVTADPGAVITYSINGGAVQELPQNTFTGIDLNVGWTLTITVTAEDGITTSEYTIFHIL